MTLFAFWQIWCLDNGREINILEFSPQEFSSPALCWECQTSNIKRIYLMEFVGFVFGQICVGLAGFQGASAPGKECEN